MSKHTHEHGTTGDQTVATDHETAEHPMQDKAHPGDVPSHTAGHDHDDAVSISPDGRQASMPSITHASHDAHQGHGPQQDHTGHEEMFRKRFWISLGLTIPILIFSPALQEWLGYTTPEFPGSLLLVPILAIIIFVYGGLPFLRMARVELQARSPGMMTLISLAISVAFIYSIASTVFDLGESFYWELATLIDVMLLGHWMEMRSVRQASGALDELAKLMPDTAERLTADGQTEVVKADQLQVGDLVLVRPGGSVPADGEVVQGQSEVNEAMITGESKPVKKEAGASVIAGTINDGSGSLRVEVSAVGDDTALSGIMRLVAEAQASKSRTQLLVDKAAALLFYAALIAAVITAIAWTVAVGLNDETLRRVVTVLVIACPHALGLAVPLVVAITTSMSARNGILVRDRRAMETARQIDVIIFDKTGTLTRGEQGVVDMVAAEGLDAGQALALAAAVERDSEHIIARALLAAAREKDLVLPDVSDFQILKGRGVQASNRGQVLYVGGPRLLEQLDITPDEEVAAFAKRSGDKGHTVIYLVQDSQISAAFALADVIRKESKEAVDKLHEMGIEVAMLTGDSEAVAKSVAEELSVDTYFAEVLPEDKDKKVRSLQEQGKRVAMVGDGVNDAPALTRADVGIAIGSGTDVAVESAGLILVKSNPLDVVKIVKLSRASQRKMAQNIWWAAGYNIIAIPLAAGILAPWGVFLPPAVGALVMSISTIIVAINAQFLRQTSLT